MTLNEVMSQIAAGSVVNFKEYVLDRHEKRILNISIEGSVVQEIIQPNTQLNRSQLELYYGEGLSDIDYLQLSSMSCPRLILNLGMNEQHQTNIKIITLNDDFIRMGLQVVEVTSEVSLSEAPSYMSAMNMWG